MTDAPSEADLLAELLSKPVGPEVANREPKIEDFTNKIELVGDTLSVTLRDEAGLLNEGRALRYIEDEGQDPTKWEVSSWYKVEYGPKAPVVDEEGNPVRDDDGEILVRPTMESVKFTFRRRQEALSASLGVDEALRVLEDYQPPARPLERGSHGFLVLLGDLQAGKCDGDGSVGTVRRAIECLDEAAFWLSEYRRIFDIGHVHVAWLGDHVEGFVSQGGANAWRTSLTLSEQVRVVRRIMLHALKTFAPTAERVTMAAVPGNHGETVRFEGHGLTRYDDSHDTEALISVKDAADLLPESFGHVEFYVPDTDELTVMVEVAGTKVAHAHGHKFGNKKSGYFEWWEKQAFNRDSNMHVADLLVAGHLHHEHIDTDADRTFIQVPALESESTWFRHSKGTTGAPGLMIAITKDGKTPIKQVVHGTVNQGSV